MPKLIEFDAVCTSCKGSGVFVGLAERDGISVICTECTGTGCVSHRIEYEPFRNRRTRTDVTRVLRSNPGICCGTNNSLKLTDFGGMPYDDWLNGEPFPPKSEMRVHSCPAWWFQCVDYSKKPRWAECLVGGFFSACKHFADKAGCWGRWDKEQEEPKP